jgi:hypothetical protein
VEARELQNDYDRRDADAIVATLPAGVDASLQIGIGAGSARNRSAYFFPGLRDHARRSSRKRGKKKGVTFACDPAVHVVGDTGFEPVTPAV